MNENEKQLKEFLKSCPLINGFQTECYNDKTYFVIRIKHIPEIVTLNSEYSKSSYIAINCSWDIRDGFFGDFYIPDYKTQRAFNNLISYEGKKIWCSDRHSGNLTYSYMERKDFNIFKSNFEKYLNKIITQYKEGYEWSVSEKMQHEKELYKEYHGKVSVLQKQIAVLQKQIAAENKIYNNYCKKRNKSEKRLRKALKDF